MLRPLYIVGSLYIALSAFVLMTRSPEAVPRTHGTDGPATVEYTGTAAGWYQKMKPYCNTVEVETRHRWMPPPATEEGAAYSGACYALAGKIDKARDAIMSVDDSRRWQAAGIVFQVAHPVADAGDDVSAGPIMELVVEFWPNHYMALYHAGISQYTLGNHDRARIHLRKFLEYYDQNDGWTRNARTVLEELGDG